MFKSNKIAKVLCAIGTLVSLPLLMLSCSEVDQFHLDDDFPTIGFSAAKVNATKAVEINDGNVNDYGFYAIAYQADAEEVKPFYNSLGQAMSLKYKENDWNTCSGEGAVVKYYWPIQCQYKGTQTPTATLSFFVYGPQSAASVHDLNYVAPSLSDWAYGIRPALTFSIPDDASTHIDLLAAADQNRTYSDKLTAEQNRVAVTMQHLCSHVALKVCKRTPDDNVDYTITNVKIGDLYYKGKASFSTTTEISSGKATEDQKSWSFANPGSLSAATDTVTMNSMMMVPQVINESAKISVSYSYVFDGVTTSLTKSIDLKGIGGIDEFEMGYRYIYIAKIDDRGDLIITVTVKPWDVQTLPINPTNWEYKE
jgi:hypothetical protein